MHGRKSRVSRCRTGNSPACAGKTRSLARRRRTAARGTAPRARGRLARPRCVTRCAGTAPRARGRPHPVGWCTRSVREGNSPACAGTDCAGTGSPPIGQASRNSPACAGKTARLRAPACVRSREQPRVRGDDVLDWIGTYPVAGTAPRARGRRPIGRLRAFDEGTAPRARGRRRRAVGCHRSSCREQPRVRGDDTMCPPPPSPPQEQPRVRGDDVTRRRPPSGLAGTAPRARGRRILHFEPVATRSARRNSPACAGTTLADLGVYRAAKRFSIGLVRHADGTANLPAVSTCHLLPDATTRYDSTISSSPGLVQQAATQVVREVEVRRAVPDHRLPLHVEGQYELPLQ